jgi:adenylate kinase
MCTKRILFVIICIACLQSLEITSIAASDEVNASMVNDGVTYANNNELSANETNGLTIILLGPPGSGKGTQAKMIVDKYHVKHVTTGDVLRENVLNETPLGVEAKKFMEAGKLVSDPLLIDIIKDRLSRDDVKGGWILDGYPRTIAQAEALDKILADLGQRIDLVLNINVTDEYLIKRVTGRRMCKCGATYHIEFNPPKMTGKCDFCGGDLYQRADDTEDTVKQRMQTYHNQTQLLIDYYNKSGIVATVLGVGDINAIFDEIIVVLDKYL